MIPVKWRWTHGQSSRSFGVISTWRQLHIPDKTSDHSAWSIVQQLAISSDVALNMFSSPKVPPNKSLVGFNGETTTAVGPPPWGIWTQQDAGGKNTEKGKHLSRLCWL
jgi:hypothetical protein